MVRIDTILESLVVACRQSNRLPNAVTYSTIVLDGEGDHSDVSPPIIEFSVDGIERDQSRNTERVGMVYADNGDEEAYIYESWFTATIDAEIFTVASTDFTHRDLETALQTSLYAYDAHGLDHSLPDPVNTTDELEDVSWLVYQATNPDHNFDFNPTARTRQTTLEVGFNHEFLSTDFTEHDIVEAVVPNADIAD